MLFIGDISERIRPPSNPLLVPDIVFHNNPRQTRIMMDMLKVLKLHGMAQALGDLAAQDSPAYQSASRVLSGLLKAELAEREVRSLAYQMKVARFPAYRVGHAPAVCRPGYPRRVGISAI